MVASELEEGWLFFIVDSSDIPEVDVSVRPADAGFGVVEESRWFCHNRAPTMPSERVEPIMIRTRVRCVCFLGEVPVGLFIVFLVCFWAREAQSMILLYE